MKQKVTFLISLLLIANLALAETVNKKRISLQRRDVPIKREIMNEPQVWYDSDSYEMEIFTNQTGTITVYYEGEDGVYSINPLWFNINYVYCDKHCNLIVLEMAAGTVYEGYLKEESNPK